jgi:hypothetical protein
VLRKAGNERGGGRRDRAREYRGELLRNPKALGAIGKDQAEVHENEIEAEKPAVVKEHG